MRDRIRSRAQAHTKVQLALPRSLPTPLACFAVPSSMGVDLLK